MVKIRGEWSKRASRDVVSEDQAGRCCGRGGQEGAWDARDEAAAVCTGSTPALSTWVVLATLPLCPFDSFAVSVDDTAGATAAGATP